MCWIRERRSFALVDAPAVAARVVTVRAKSDARTKRGNIETSPQIEFEMKKITRRLYVDLAGSAAAKRRRGSPFTNSKRGCDAGETAPRHDGGRDRDRHRRGRYRGPGALRGAAR